MLKPKTNMAVTAETGAWRLNGGKIPLSIVPPSLNYYVAAVMDFGASKYERDNWRQGFPFTSLIDSAERHMASFKAGSNYDVESKLHELAHLACNVAFLIEHVEQGYGVDDRVVVTHFKPRALIKC